MVSRVVVDTSIAVKWVLFEKDTAQAEALRNRWDREQTTIVVPSWFACEVANVLYQKVRSSDHTLATAQLSVVTLLKAVTVHDYEPALAVRALDLARALGEPACYDAQYLALAEHLNCELWTADKSFWEATKIAFPRVRWIGEVA